MMTTKQKRHRLTSTMVALTSYSIDVVRLMREEITSWAETNGYDEPFDFEESFATYDPTNPAHQKWEVGQSADSRAVGVFTVTAYAYKKENPA